ncbi:MAG: cytochrome c3 family protein [Planctomycetales bacterium]|nr:cytochrome c3 family protein [Planctomycetales bacterium]
MHCHKEHEGKPLANVRDAHCLNCHSKTVPNADGEVASSVKVVSSFAQHPPFALHEGGSVNVIAATGNGRSDDPGVGDKSVQLAKDGLDPGNIRFSHKAHLGLSFEDFTRRYEDNAEGRVAKHLQQLQAAGRDKLICSDCHDAADDGRYMRPIRFEDHCSACHPLSFHSAIAADGDLPHAKPALVRAVILDRLGTQSGESPDRSSPPPRLPNKTRTDHNAENVFRVVREGCIRCHQIQNENENEFDFDVVESRIPTRWLPNGEFSHHRHSSDECSDCHGDVRSSVAATDILIPNIDSCKKCHGKSSGLNAGLSVRADCILCHNYHTHTKALKSAKPDDPTPSKN